MEADEPVTTFPPESSTLTTGWAPKATPLVELLGDVVNTSWVADPVASAKVFEVSPLSPVAAALREKLGPAVPAREHPAKGATPPEALSVLLVQVSAPDEGVRVMEADELVTRLPPESSTWTTGWVLKATPLVELPGDVVKFSWMADPTASEK